MATVPHVAEGADRDTNGLLAVIESRMLEDVVHNDEEGVIGMVSVEV